MLGILKQFNWLDIFVLIVLLRICCVATSNGFSIEFFKFLGTVLATYLSLHYYIIFATYIVNRIGLEKIPLEYLAFVFLIILAIFGYAIFVILRMVFYRFIQIDAVPTLNKWGGLLLGLTRGILGLSLIMFILVSSPVVYLRNSVIAAYTSKYLFKVAPTVYCVLWNNIASKFISQEKLNQTVLEAPQHLTPEK